MKLSRQAGFTYLEMLISLALLGLISVVLASSLEFGRQVWKRAGAYSEIEQTAILRSSLRDWMQEIDDHATIKGTHQIISFKVQPTIVPHPDIFHMDVRLEIEKEQRSDVLSLSLTGYDVTNKVIFKDKRILQSGLNEITINYYGRITPQDPKAWRNDWDFEIGHIDLIKITAKGASGSIFIPFTARIGASLTQRKISASSLVPPD